MDGTSVCGLLTLTLIDTEGADGADTDSILARDG